MSEEKSIAPKEKATVPSLEEHWRELQVRAGGGPDTDEEAAGSPGGTEGGKGRRAKRPPSRRARIVAAAVLIVLAMASAWAIASALTGRDPTRLSQPAPGVVHAKARGRSSARTRWVGEPDQAAGPHRRHAAPAAPRMRHRVRQRHRPRRPAPTQDVPSQPPAPGAAPPQPAPEPSPPPPPPPSEPKEKPGLRDGATESEEFGL